MPNITEPKTVEIKYVCNPRIFKEGLKILYEIDRGVYNQGLVMDIKNFDMYKTRFPEDSPTIKHLKSVISDIEKRASEVTYTRTLRATIEDLDNLRNISNFNDLNNYRYEIIEKINKSFVPCNAPDVMWYNHRYIRELGKCLTDITNICLKLISCKSENIDICIEALVKFK